MVSGTIVLRYKISRCAGRGKAYRSDFKDPIPLLFMYILFFFQLSLFLMCTLTEDNGSEEVQVWIREVRGGVGAGAD